MENNSKEKIIIAVDKDHPCLKEKKDVEREKSEEMSLWSSGSDPRFQQQNQTQRCFVMYTDFYRCEHILGKDTHACKWFKDVFTSVCPSFWVQQWDELRLTGRLAWHKYRTQGTFPGSKYGE
ncbi:cytochrome c oxidase subunit 6b-3-like [Pseudomyrmex gracilis]|uniref:cytochrome c oxidase subunit 6b-3-like n=1 Tax=Pseudomyrmex gracilis TaxID=219809 RepID=UPI0009953A3A|nr:cytochrome c oxidase subunit 6b-3-like [Pseudomyrmex gracilis]